MLGRVAPTGLATILPGSPYRGEIDGLRALAVLPVILFHAGVGAFDAGFVGVDVFFVVSRYLITSIILAVRTQGTFSPFRFYGRRARRVLPARLLVVAACVPVAWILLLPNDYEDVSESLAAVAVFASNVMFHLRSGYFEAAPLSSATSTRATTRCATRAPASRSASGSQMRGCTDSPPDSACRCW